MRDYTKVSVGILDRMGDLPILLSRRTKKNTDWFGYWELPGGKMILGERSSDTIRRELYEELGVYVDENMLPLPKIYDHKKKICINPFFIFKWSGKIFCAEGQTLKWIHPLKMDNLYPIFFSIRLILSNIYYARKVCN